MKSPILFLIFNRPDETREVFARIRTARPERLYVAADGPRSQRPGEAATCETTRAIATGVDWPCKVHTLFRSENLGCKVAVSSGISWFFEHEPEGIILEDDIVPLPSFFTYAQALLERYRDDDRVMMINGSNLISERYRSAASYFFSSYAHVWGWASWRRAWRHYDVSIADWPEVRRAGAFAAEVARQRYWDRYWYPNFNAVHLNECDTWDYQWSYALLKRGGLATTPRTNLVTNIGFGAGATHTTFDVPSYVAQAVTEELEMPLGHPPVVERDRRADHIEDLHLYGLHWSVQVVRWLNRVPMGRQMLAAARSGRRAALTAIAGRGTAAANGRSSR